MRAALLRSSRPAASQGATATRTRRLDEQHARRRLALCRRAWISACSLAISRYPRYPARISVLPWKVMQAREVR
jgi:hypothetical protein